MAFQKERRALQAKLVVPFVFKVMIALTLRLVSAEDRNVWLEHFCLPILQ
ncbi:MAG TPA: hypothetical protein VIF64_13915 [Pyrinomonadaceae bacterium]|jgi:hypothetical protein